jgi:hypothetical protein
VYRLILHGPYGLGKLKLLFLWCYRIGKLLVPENCKAIADSTAVGNIIEEILPPVPEPLTNIENNDETVYFIHFHVTVLASQCTTYSLNWLNHVVAFFQLETSSNKTL